jgi:predicted MFS family arabinose efflux permease
MDQPTTSASSHAQTPEIKGFSTYQILVIIMLAVLQFTIILDFMIISPLGDILMKSIGLTTAQFGSVVSAYALSAGISGILTAGFADKFDRKRLLLFFYSGFILGTFFCALAYDYQTLFIARMVTGLFGGVVGSISMAIVADLFALQQRGRVIGYIQMAFAGSQILGVPIGLLLANQWGWHATFYFVVCVAACILLLVIWKLKPLTDHLAQPLDKNALQHLWHTIQKRHYRTGFLATAFLSLGGFLLMPFTSAFMVNNVGIAQESLPVVFFFTGITSMLIMPLIGRISDRVDKFKIFVIGSCLAATMVVVYTNMPPSPLWVMVIVNMVLFMGIMSRMVPASALNSAVPALYDRGAYMSINASLQQMAGGLAAMFAGMVVVQESAHSPLKHFDLLGYIMVAIMALCIFLVYRISVIVKTNPVVMSTK